jgi:hypothetical protein
MVHQTVAVCGHKYNHNRQPRHRNCEQCWYAFFVNHGELVQTTDEVYQKYGADAITTFHGKTYLDNFLAFMSTLAHFQADQAKLDAVTEAREQ